MNQDRRDALLDQDWSAAWETLPEAPPLVPRRKTAQITLRIPPRLLDRVKRVAAEKSLPYHGLARAWIVDALRTSVQPTTSPAADELRAEQFNIKLDAEALDDLKRRADEVRRPYHRLAREWIEAAVAREEESLGIDPRPAGGPPIKDLMVLLLHATNKRGEDAIHGITRLQKLLFVVEQQLASRGRFYACDYGPFNEEVNDAAHALRLAGFLHGAEAASPTPPSFAHMMATVLERSGPGGDTEAQEFALNERGHEAAERLRQSNRRYARLYELIGEVRTDWDAPHLDDLVDRVYETYPKYAQRSLIRDKVARRRERRRAT